MRLPVAHKPNPVRAEQIILFRASTQIFAISSASVQEVKSVDSLAGAAMEINQAELPKVRHALRRGERNLYVVNAALHFGLRASPAGLIFLLRKARTALLVDGIEKMTTMTRLQAMPRAFCHEERVWYRGLTILDQSVIPVVNPGGFLTTEEILLLDSASGSKPMAEALTSAGAQFGI